jgi:hypothetical protein
MPIIRRLIEPVERTGGGLWEISMTINRSVRAASSEVDKRPSKILPDQP